MGQHRAVLMISTNNTTDPVMETHVHNEHEGNQSGKKQVHFSQSHFFVFPPDGRRRVKGPSALASL